MIFASKLLGLSELQLKEKQYEVEGLNNKDVLAFLPTGYGKTEFVSGGCTFKKKSAEKNKNGLDINMTYANNKTCNDFVAKIAKR